MKKEIQRQNAKKEIVFFPDCFLLFAVISPRFSLFLADLASWRFKRWRFLKGKTREN
jgi:hypothetical protein